MTVDAKGNPAAAGGEGIVKMDAATGKYTAYKPLTAKQGSYGLAHDADDNIWLAQSGGDQLMYVDKTGKVGEVLFEPRLREPWITPKDTRIAQTMEASVNFGWPHAKGPRRLGADPRGTTLWVAHFKSDQLAKVDIRGKRVEKEYPVPTKGSGPYGTVVDKNHMVWVQMLNGDRIGKFDPKTERWVEYQLPTRNTQMRHLTVDNRTDPPTVWAPYGGTNKIMRMQIRSSDSRAAK
jgi:streptogramin lyase